MKSIFIFLNEIIQYIIDQFPYLLPLLWITAIFVYGFKFLNARWNRFTLFGKLEDTSSWGAIPTIPNKAGWILFYLFSCFMFFMTLFVQNPPKLGNYLLFFHSSRRILESIFITKFSQRRMHFINFLAGLTFYAMAPMTIAYCSHLNDPISHQARSLLIVLAIILNILQFLAHFELASLPKYTIPTTFLFAKVTSPHYTIEILLYFIYFLSSINVLTFLMLVFVILNLTHQSIMTYKWYNEKFGSEFRSYHRSIIIPYIF